MLVASKPRFKPVKDEVIETPPPHFIMPKPQPILRPKPEDIPALVKSDVQMHFQVEATKEIAGACLALNTNNYRPPIKGWIGDLTGDFDAGQFKQTGEPLKFSISGALMDGQNRLTAFRESKLESFLFWFAVGVPEDSREVIDFGRPRKISQVVRNEGYADPYLLSAAAAFLCKIKKGQSLARGLTRGKSGSGTVEDILHMIRRHPKLHASLQKAKQSKTSVIPGSVLAAIHYIGSQLLGKPELANAFLKEVRAEEEFVYFAKNVKNRNGAAFAWRYELEERKQRGLAIGRDYKARGTIEAWNLFMTGVDVQKIEIPEKISFKDLDYGLL